MSLIINTNISSLNAQNALNTSNAELSSATEDLSTGLKINSAADNAAGYAISQEYTTQIGGLNQASSNASDAINLAQTASSALSQVTSNLQAIYDLAVQSANGTYTASDRQNINSEVQQRLSEVTRIANQTTFNGVNILDGSLGSTTFQIGANVGQTISVNLATDTKASAIGQASEVSTGSIVSPAGSINLKAGDLTIDGAAVAAGTYTTSSLQTALNAAATNGETYAVSSEGQITVNNSAGTAAATVGGTVGSTLGISSTAVGNTANSSSDLAPSTTPTVNLGSGETLKINGTNVDLTGVTDLQSLSDAVNAAGITGVSAAINGAGNGLNFYSTNGSLTVDDSGTTVIGANATDANSGAAYTNNTSASFGGSLANSNVLTVDGANDTLARVQAALTTVSNFAADLGAVQNRFQSTISTVSSQTTNLQASQSTIQDADFAAETADLSQAQVLQQAGIAVLAQANSQPQQVLKLLQ